MRIAQISDTHLSSDTLDRINDLKRCIGQINALDPLPDVVIHTGDIAHDGLPEQYKIAHRLLSTLKVPWFVMAGNRDKRPALIDAFFEGDAPRRDIPFVQYSINAFPVRLLCIDTMSEESNKGELCEERLDDFDRMLRAEPTKPIAIFMHHPPFDVTCAPDPFQFVERRVADACLELISRTPSVCGLFCGHIHRPWATQLGDVPATVMTSVALDLRFGERQPPTADTPLFELHQIDPKESVLATADHLATIK